MEADTPQAGEQRRVPPLARLLGLLAQEAPLEDFHAVLADAEVDPATVGEVREAVGSALEVRRLLAARRRREQELSALYETAGDLSSLRDLEAVLSAIVRRARQLLDSDAAYLTLHDDRRGLTAMRVTDGIRTAAFKAVELPLGDGLGGLVAATGVPVATADYGRDERLTRRIDEVVSTEGLVAILGVPLRRRERVIGVLFAANRRQRPFSPDEVALLCSLADHAAIALENATLFDELGAALDGLRTANALVQRHSAQVERAAEMHERLHDVLLRKGGLHEIAVAARDVLGGDLAVLDARGRVLEAVGDGDRVAAAVAALTAQGDLPPADAADRRTLQADADGTPVALAPVPAGAEVLGTVLQCGQVLDDAEVRMLERTAVVTALLLLSERAVAEAEQRVRGELLDDLLAAVSRDPEALERRAAHLGLDLRTPYVVLVAAAAGEAAALAPPSDPAPAGLRAVHGDALVVIAHADDAAAEAARLRVELAAALGTPVTVGGAGPATGAAAVAELHADARRCADVLTVLGRTGESASADELGVYGLLLASAGREDVSRFVRRTVGPVLDHDRERGSELTRTLLTYYGTGGNLTRTASELFVHVNTLYQRLDRVARLLPDGWRSGEGALQVHLALRAHAALGLGAAE